MSKQISNGKQKATQTKRSPVTAGDINSKADFNKAAKILAAAGYTAEARKVQKRGEKFNPNRKLTPAEVQQHIEDSKPSPIEIAGDNLSAAEKAGKPLCVADIVTFAEETKKYLGEPETSIFIKDMLTYTGVKFVMSGKRLMLAKKNN